ncbi:histone H1.11R-like [Chiloscyllium plagiosum]|uniref:histone H1.11R-like n=1 Tax=Chiloscyllium plagiosum TaxID=36176 RepID=UPI001CB88673|nr:histone H1.11R-like [Chiloscyllium plagiosum]
MANTESDGLDFSALVDSPPPAPPSPPPPPPPPPDEGEVLDIAVAVKKKRRPYRHKKFGCTVAEQIMKVVAANKERRGLSVAAMKKLLSASGSNIGHNSSPHNRAMRNTVKRSPLVKTSGSIGASRLARMGGGVSSKLETCSQRDSKKTFPQNRRRRRRVVARRRVATVKRPSRPRKVRKWTAQSRKRLSALKRGARMKKSLDIHSSSQRYGEESGTHPQLEPNPRPLANSGESTCDKNGSSQSL